MAAISGDRFEVPDEASEADAAEQSQSVTGDEPDEVDRSLSPPADADPADVADQGRAEPLDEDEYRS